MSALEPFNLHALIVDVMKEATSPDPGRIADEVLKRVTAADLAVALRAALPTYVRTVVRQQRKGVRRDARTHSAERHGPSGSSRWLDVGTVYKRFLEESVFVLNDWKFRSECTTEDCLWMYEAKLAKAKTLAVEAQREKILASAMEKADAKTVADLDEIIVMEVLRWHP